MSEPAEIIKKPKTRLKFIDMGRSIAILLMLEGHFIEHTYKDFKPMVATIREKGTSGNIFFDWFYFMKGFTAPLFFTVTGLVFVYLLARNKDAGFFRNPRVKKGFKRVLELLFWGYMLQLNMRNFDGYIKGQFGDWVFAFHVLQSIGVGIAAILLIYGLYKLVRVIPLYIWYFLAGTIILAFYPHFKSLPEGYYLPQGAPQMVQNVIRGPNSVFAIIPWMAFTMYGGMVGALIIRFQSHVKKLWFPLSFILFGIIFNAWARPIFLEFDELLNWIGLDLHFVGNAWLFGRIGQVFMALGILMIIEKYFEIKAELFLKVGQNTLPIYVIHVIILYAGIFGYGLNSFMKYSLTGWQSVVGAGVFIGIFVVFIKYFDTFNRPYQRVLNVFRFRKREIK